MQTRCYPLSAPALPFVGLDFVSMAEALPNNGLGIERDKKGKIKAIHEYGDVLPKLIDEALFSRGQFCLNVTVSSQESTPMPMVAGHKWLRKSGDIASSGPVLSDVMVVGTYPEPEEIFKKVLFQSESSQLLLDTLREFDAPNIGDWYVTNVLKTSNPGGDGATLKSSWITNQLHLLHQEILLVQPKKILLLGSEAVKAFFGKSATIKKYEADVADYYVDLRKDPSEEPNGYYAKVMVCSSPRSVFWSQEMLPAFKKGIKRFVDFLNGHSPNTFDEKLDIRVIESEKDLRSLCSEIDQVTTTKIIAMDAEWNGEHPQNSNAYLRTIQLSWNETSAAVIKLRAAGGERCFKTDTFDTGEDCVASVLTEFMKDKRPCGHYFNADMEWFEDIGLDLREAFKAPDTWQECKEKGGLDTALMAHAYDEVADFSLTSQTLLHTTVPRYDIELDKWKASYCSKQGIKSKDLEGYGDCPDDILIPYAALDAIVTYRLAMFYMSKLDKDPYGNNCWPAFWVSQKAAVGVLEMKTTGLMLDNARVDELTLLYMRKVKEYSDKVKKYVNWEELNLNSPFHMRELLFGTKYNGKDPIDGVRPRLRPRMAKSVAATPILDTSKRPKLWSEIQAEDKEDKHTPSTDRMTLGILNHAAKDLEVRRHGQLTRRNVSKLIQTIRDYKFLSHTLRAALRPPTNLQCEEDDSFSYAAGLAASVCDDGFVRTTIYQTKETGRWSSARPALQNLCFDMDTQILTTRGFVYFDELEEYDQVACYDPNTEDVIFEVPQELQSYQYKGNMVSIKSDDYDMLVTPNHRLLYVDSDGDTHREVLAEEFYPGMGDFVCLEFPSTDAYFVSTDDAKVQYEFYDGTVNCVTVSTSFVVVRRNGKAYVSGNSKRRESDYKRILKDEYKYPIRSILRARPGWCLVEADYIGAELFVMAALSGDEIMLEHARRNQLPESDPDFYDIHSNVCVLAFNLDCEPTKKGLESAGVGYLRNVAKAVN